MRAITLRIGPLSGVEPALLEAAYEIARRDTIAADARLVIERSVVRVRCRTCGAVCGAEPANLLCAGCGSADTELRGGDECLLLELDLTVAGSQA